MMVYMVHSFSFTALQLCSRGISVEWHVIP